MDPFSKPNKKNTLNDNKNQGKAAEMEVVSQLEFEGYIKIKRTGKGSDYSARWVDPITGEESGPYFFEIKSGNAKLSELQKKTQKRLGKYYIVIRRQPNTFVVYKDPNFSGGLPAFKDPLQF